MAKALEILTTNQWKESHKVIHLTDKFPATTPDEEWISTLAQEKNWVVITHDRFNKGLEREALRRAGLTVFMLDKSWGHQKFWDKSIQVLRWWPRIIEQSEGVRGGAAFRVKWNFSGKGFFEQISV